MHDLQTADTGTMGLGLAEALWDRHRRKPARNHDRLNAQNLLAGAYMAQGRYAKAEVLYRELLAVSQRLGGADDENVLGVALNLGMVLRNQDKSSEAEAVLRDTLPKMHRVLGPEHELTLRLATALAGALQYQRKYDEAERLLRVGGADLTYLTLIDLFFDV